MATFYISGIWKDTKGVIYGYAVHEKSSNGVTRATKYTKQNAIALVENSSNQVYTRVWDYRRADFITGEKVSVVGTYPNKYLRSNPDDTVTDNLGHLIDFDWIASL
jgi:hypothetical protein